MTTIHNPHLFNLTQKPMRDVNTSTSELPSSDEYYVCGSIGNRWPTSHENLIQEFATYYRTPSLFSHIPQRRNEAVDSWINYDASEKVLFNWYDELRNQLTDAERKQTREEIEIESALEDMPNIARLSNAKVMQTHRFIERRGEFLKRYDVYGAKEFANAMSIMDLNKSRAVKRLSDSHQVLAVTMQSGTFYPAFQLDEQACVYPSLKKHLPKMHEYMTGWDIAFWLTRPTTVTTAIYSLSEEKKKIAAEKLTRSLDELAQFIADDDTPSGTVTFAPLELLLKGDDAMFDIFVDALINEDTREIPQGEC
jgi:hypothetical protein